MQKMQFQFVCLIYDHDYIFTGLYIMFVPVAVNLHWRNLHHALTYAMLWPTPWCFLCHAVSHATLWPTPCYDLHHALTYAMLWPTPCYDLHHAMTCAMLWHLPCCDLDNAVTYAILWPLRCCDLHHAATSHFQDLLFGLSSTKTYFYTIAFNLYYKITYKHIFTLCLLCWYICVYFIIGLNR